MSYHRPVLEEEAVAGLLVRPDGVYVDATFGGGGHSRRILEQLGPKGRLLAFDQDPDAARNVPDDERVMFIPHNFRHLKRFLRLYGVAGVHGILADLGVSSHQFDEAERGFSYRFDAELDMRMDPRLPKTAAQVVNTYSAEDLQEVLGRYGEVRNARTLAQHICAEREAMPVRTTADLVRMVEPLIRGQRLRYLSQVFQALRIEVNEEMEVLREFLEQTLDVLQPEGRLVVISYHSLEDRMVKNFLRSGHIDGTVEKDFYGNIYRPFEVITRKAIKPASHEIAQNPRARSARLRIGALKEKQDG